MAAAQRDEHGPSVALAPDEVVARQLAGLRSETGDDAGLAVVWRYASPANRAATGPFPRFVAMLRGSAYRGLVGFRTVQHGQVVVSGDSATCELLVQTAAGAVVGFTFLLSRQGPGPYPGCWMTDGVLRH